MKKDDMEWEMGEKKERNPAHCIYSSIQLTSGFKFGVITVGQDKPPPYIIKRDPKMTQNTRRELQKMHNQDMDLALSTDAKPRLKWTPLLHQRFVEAVTQLGGAERATPKSLMRVMGVPELTLYHLKSHLQKFRLGKNQQTEMCNGNDQEESDTEGGIMSGKVMDETQTQIDDESLHVAQTLQMQMEVQNKLHEQIEVQKHLQLRIEAQGMYLQSILKKAQETLAGYNSSSTGLETAKTEVSELVSLVETGCLSSAFSDFTNTGFFILNDVGKRSMRVTDCSVDSSLTSSESCGRKDGKQLSSYRLAGRKRSGSTISDESCVEQPVSKRPPSHEEKPELDLNCKYQSESVRIRQELDLNCAEPEMFHES